MHSTPRLTCAERELNRALELALIPTCIRAMQEKLDLNLHRSLPLNKNLPLVHRHLLFLPAQLNPLLLRFQLLLLPMNAEEDALQTKDAAMDNASIQTTTNVRLIPPMENRSCVQREILEVAMEDVMIHLLIDARMES